jgi:hypothetical protein
MKKALGLKPQRFFFWINEGLPAAFGFRPSPQAITLRQ